MESSFVNRKLGTLNSLMTNRKNFELMSVWNIKFENKRKKTILKQTTETLMIFNDSKIHTKQKRNFQRKLL